jgi:TolB protein
MITRFVFLSCLLMGGGMTFLLAGPVEVRSTVKTDLEFTGLFNVIEGGPPVNKDKDVANWVGIGAEMVLTADIKTKRNHMVAYGEMFDVGQIKQVLSTKTSFDTENPYYVGHDLANQVVEYVTGQPGIFLSKLAFVNNSTGRKELYVGSYNAKVRTRLTNDNSIVVLPRISPDGQKIVFTSYRSGNPDLFIMDSDGQNRRLLSSKAGLNVSPSWSPNNKELAITLSHQGPPNIYLMDLRGIIKKRITNSQGADTAPTFSPDGSQIAFTSDRAGQPHIWVTHIDGTGTRRLTTDGHCDSAAWSPDGTTVVYVKGKRGNKFDIYSIEVLTGIERRLTWNQGNSENPTWSPDGRHIIFISTRRGKSELFVMDWDGDNQRPIYNGKGESFTPHWSR